MPNEPLSAIRMRFGQREVAEEDDRHSLIPSLRGIGALVAAATRQRKRVHLAPLRTTLSYSWLTLPQFRECRWSWE
jgi:hypothetical protein